MKISSGWCKGMTVVAPEGEATRPTRSRVRESALNLVQPWIDGARVLDLFAGTGAFGIECLSRGGLDATFVESSKVAFTGLMKNVTEARRRAEKQNLHSVRMNPLLADVFKFAKKEFASNSFDLIWADPPYDSVERFLNDVGTGISSALEKNGAFVLESHSDSLKLIDQWVETTDLEIIKQKQYGISLITVMSMNQAKETV